MISTPDEIIEKPEFKVYENSFSVEYTLEQPCNNPCETNLLLQQDITDITNKQFINPSVDFSREPSEFLREIELSNHVGYAFINKPKEEHFHYDFEPMLKLMLYQRLSRVRYLSILEERLKQNADKCATNLGFKRRYTPDRRTIGMFYFDYIEKDGHQQFFGSLVKRCKDICSKLGIPFGKRIGVDSTPLETLPNDGIGEYNAHYIQTKHLGKMVKVHVASCLDTGIPLAFIVSGANECDEKYLIPLLEKLKALGIDVEEVYGDGHYDIHENWAKINILHKAKCYFNLRDDSIYNPNGCYEEIKRQYQKFHTCNDFVVSNELSLEFMARYLIERGIYDCVGSYHRNQWFNLKMTEPFKYIEIYSKRNHCENLFSILKEQLGFENNLVGNAWKGWDKLNIYTSQFLIGLVVVALIRLENGISDGLMKISEGVFH